MRPLILDGSPERIAALVTALESALRGGPAVRPLGAAAGPGTVITGSVTSRSVTTEAGTTEAGTTESVITEPGPGIALVVATSGSTGEPKLVALSAAALRASARATEVRLGGPARWLLALPAEHIGGAQVIVRALLAGHPPAVQDLRAGFRPADFATATAALGPGRRATSLVPTQLGRLLDAGAAALDALRGYDAVLIGGAALPAALRRRARRAGVRIVTTYGMSETAGGCVYDGTPLDGVGVELDDDGRIRLGGPTLAEGYLGRPDDTALAFTGGRFRTGDLGRWTDGRLEVLGRADDMIITGGEKVAPAAVERVLTAQPGVRAACAVGLPDAEWGQIVTAVVAGPGTAGVADRARLRDAVRAELGRAAVPRRLVAVAEIPLRGIGKPDRAAVAAIVAAHTAPETTG